MTSTWNAARRIRVSPGTWRWIVLALATSCGGTIATTDLTTTQVAEVVVAPLTSNVVVGGTLPLQATVRDASGQTITGPTVVWSVQDTTIATISSGGVLTARAVGSTQVAASANGESGIASVTVMPVPVASVTVSPARLELARGVHAALRALVYDASGRMLTDRTTVWSSSNSGVAIVDDTGAVAAVAAGSATVTATTEGVSGSTTVSVVIPAIASVIVQPGSTTLTAGQSITLSATVKDASGAVVTDRPVAWTSSNAAAASVSQTGLVTALGAGTATISATSEGITGSATVTVSPPAVASISLQPTIVTLQRNMTATLTPTLNDAHGNVLTGRVIIWKSSDSTVARVSGSGVVTAVRLGTATITASSEGRSATAAVTVATGPVDRILISPSSINNLREGHTSQLTATAVDANGDAISGAAFTWHSDDPSVATVSSTGKVTAEHSGTATITATFSGKTGSASVRVK